MAVAYNFIIMVRLIFVILVIFLRGGQILYAQEFTPIVRSYDKENYQADNYNWSVSSSDDIICFGNGQGLLTFDGYRWELSRLPENKTARTVFVDGDMIYVGSYEEFGFFSRNSYGNLEYVSLSVLIPDYEMQNDEIWRILKHDGKVIFQSFTSFFVYDGNEVRALRMPEFCLFFNVCGERILTSSDESGLVSVDPDTGSLTKVAGTTFKSQLVSVLPCADGKWFLLTYSDGIFIYDGKSFLRFNTEVDSELPDWQPNNAIMTPSGNIVIGTKLNGAVCIDASGRKLWRISNSNALNSNTVLGMDFDCDGNLWLALDGGLAKVNIDPSLTYIRSISPSVGSIFTILYRKPYLYMGTGQGLYMGRLSEDITELSDVRNISEVLGNVWHIDTYGSQIFCGTNYDTFELIGNTPTVTSVITGGSCMDEGVINGKNVLVQGTYTYPCIYLKKNGKWVFGHALTDFMQPLNTIEIDYSGTIWAGHKYKGLYSFRLSSDLTKIDTMNFYPSLDGVTERPISVYTINGRVIFLDGATGFYTYDDLNERIVPFTELNEALKDYPSSVTVCHFKDNLYWFISSTSAALVGFNGKDVEVADVIPYRIFGSNILDEDQSITPISDDRCVIALGNSLALYDLSAVKAKDKGRREMKILRIRMHDLETHRDSLLRIEPESRVRVPYRFRNIRVSYSIPTFDEAEKYSFRYSVDGDGWSYQDDSPSASFMHLKRGRHTLSAQTLSASGEVVSQSDYEVKVVYPFYMTVPAYILYILLAAGLAAGSMIAWTRLRKVKETSEEESDEHRFFRILRERYPSLTDNDLRFCACLRSNLSSKEIAARMNISLKGVEAARSRIRKKIGLSSSESLTTFMVDLK